MLSDLHMFRLILFNFTCFCSLFAMKLTDANYKSHSIVLTFCAQLKMISDLNMSHGKMSDFV